MEEKKFEWFKGDKALWVLVFIVSLWSIPIVYSASSNLEYVSNQGTTLSHTIKHISFIIGGFAIMLGIVNFIRPVFWGVLGIVGLTISAILLVVAMLSGTTIDGASASRWINIGGFSFQPSSFAYLFLIIYLCRQLSKMANRKMENKDIALIALPILAVVGLVFKDNGSTGLMIFGVSVLVLAIGQFSLKYIATLVGIGTIIGGAFIYLALYTDIFKETRVHTWVSRIENFRDEDKNKNKNYQVLQAKAAIVNGKIGQGPGKSAQKGRLPQSASDFVFAIVVEEYGVIGAVGLMFFYFCIILRLWNIAKKTNWFFYSLLAISFSVIFLVQIAVNILVAVNLFPVTGQPLPFISYGGSAILVTYIMFGIALSISADIQVYGDGIGKKQSIEEINDIA